MSNPDLEYQWVVTQPPLVGIDKTRGTAEKPSPIESFIFLAYGTTDWPDKRMRSRFHIEQRRARLMDLLRNGLGPERIGPEHPDPDFTMLGDPRLATRFTIDGVDTHLGRIFALASYGKDENGKDIWDVNIYDVGVDRPGAFSFPHQPGEDGWRPNEIIWTPVKKTAPPESVMPIDQPMMEAYPGHFWWKSAFGWVMAPFSQGSK